MPVRGVVWWDCHENMVRSVSVHHPNTANVLKDDSTILRPGRMIGMLYESLVQVICESRQARSVHIDDCNVAGTPGPGDH